MDKVIVYIRGKRSYVHKDACQDLVIKGVLHRENGPAIIFPSEYKAWFFKGVRHRVDGPAIINLTYNSEWWYFKGKCHRLNGPAITINGEKSYFINDCQYTLTTYNRIIKWL